MANSPPSMLPSETDRPPCSTTALVRAAASRRPAPCALQGRRRSGAVEAVGLGWYAAGCGFDDLAGQLGLGHDEPERDPAEHGDSAAAEGRGRRDPAGCHRSDHLDPPTRATPFASGLIPAP